MKLGVEEFFNVKSGPLIGFYTMVIIGLSLYVVRHNSINATNHIDIPPGVTWCYGTVISVYAGSKGIKAWMESKTDKVKEGE